MHKIQNSPNTGFVSIQINTQQLLEENKTLVNHIEIRMLSQCQLQLYQSRTCFLQCGMLQTPDPKISLEI